MQLRCTHFASPSGIVDRDNYSCTTDLAVLAHAVLQQPLLAPIVASRSAVIRFPIKGGKLYLYNNNPLLLRGLSGHRRRQDRLHGGGRALPGGHGAPRHGVAGGRAARFGQSRRRGPEAVQRRLRQAGAQLTARVRRVRPRAQPD